MQITFRRRHTCTLLSTLLLINPTSNVRLTRQQWDRASIIDCTQYKQYLDDLLLL